MSVINPFRRKPIKPARMHPVIIFSILESLLLLNLVINKRAYLRKKYNNPRNPINPVSAKIPRKTE